MTRDFRIRTLLLTAFLAALSVPGLSQEKDNEDKKETTALPAGKAVMWEAVDIESRDLFAGPGGQEMAPNISRVEFIKEEKDGHNKKYRIRDANGKVWVAKLGREAQPETAAVRLVWGLGYKTEVNYLVRSITIPGKGTFENVRLEARPESVERLIEWKWRDNPFVGTNELEGLKMMMVFLNNWDVLDLQNKVLHTNGELHYIVSDLGSTFGRLGNNNLPVVYRLGRSTGKPDDYVNTKFIVGIQDGKVDLAYKGKNRDLFEGFSPQNAAWLAGLLNRLSDKQIKDAFRAARYSESDIELFAAGVKNRIAELNKVARPQNVAANE